jgi:hypothetical protein
MSRTRLKSALRRKMPQPAPNLFPHGETAYFISSNLFHVKQVVSRETTFARGLPSESAKVMSPSGPASQPSSQG